MDVITVDERPPSRSLVATYVITLFCYGLGLVAALSAIAVQSFAATTCDQTDVPMVSMGQLRATVVVPTAILVAYTIGCAVFLYRRTKSYAHVWFWGVLGGVTGLAGSVIAATIQRGHWCF